MNKKNWHSIDKHIHVDIKCHILWKSKLKITHHTYIRIILLRKYCSCFHQLTSQDKYVRKTSTINELYLYHFSIYIVYNFIQLNYQLSLFWETLSYPEWVLYKDYLAFLHYFINPSQEHFLSGRNVSCTKYTNSNILSYCKHVSSGMRKNETQIS